MSLDQLESQLMNLPKGERLEFAKWFYDHEHELFTDVDQSEISESVIAEVDRRHDDIKSGRVMAVPVTDEWFAQLRKKLSDALPAQASSR